MTQGRLFYNRQYFIGFGLAIILLKILKICSICSNLIYFFIKFLDEMNGQELYVHPRYLSSSTCTFLIIPSQGKQPKLSVTVAQW